MKRIPTSAYPSQAEIDARIDALEMRAMGVPPESEDHRNIMKELSNLRTYAAMKSWLRPIAPRPRSMRSEA